jgi:hypothetical protein
MTGATRPVRGPLHSTAFLIETQVRIEIAATHRKQRKAASSNRNFFRGSGKSEERSFRLRPAPAKLRRGRKIARGFAQDDGIESKTREKRPPEGGRYIGKRKGGGSPPVRRWRAFWMPALHGTGPSLLARGIPAGEGFAGAFFDGEEDVDGEVDDGFAEAAGPPDFERVDAGVGAEAEEDARVLRGAVAHRIVIHSAARPWDRRASPAAQHAASATLINSMGTATNVSGSVGWTPKSSDAITRVTAAGATSPRKIPSPAIRMPWPRIIANTFAGWAPSAIRMPNSRVRCATA